MKFKACYGPHQQTLLHQQMFHFTERNSTILNQRIKDIIMVYSYGFLFDYKTAGQTNPDLKLSSLTQCLMFVFGRAYSDSIVLCTDSL